MCNQHIRSCARQSEQAQVVQRAIDRQHMVFAPGQRRQWEPLARRVGLIFGWRK
jgi:hypothetical protein